MQDGKIDSTSAVAEKQMNTERKKKNKKKKWKELQNSFKVELSNINCSPESV